jgi:hypothetical protein
MTKRNHYVDFLRAYSMLIVVVGHWVLSVPYMGEQGQVVAGHLMVLAPWSQYTTWISQVMPIFFFIGGYSNLSSWLAHKEKGKTYTSWITARVKRLIDPIFPLILFWVGFIVIGHFAGLGDDLVYASSSFGIVPVWFLAVYLLITALVPLTLMAWKRFGMLFFWGCVALTVGIDVIGFNLKVPLIGDLNYLFVWVAIHQLGYAWQAGHFKGLSHRALWALGGFICAVLLVTVGPYPLAMVDIPDAPIVNLMPPSLALLSLGVMQAGIVLLLEPIGQRLLKAGKFVDLISVINGRMMTIFLWHLTGFQLVIGIAVFMGGFGLHMIPEDPLWWLTRPIWIVLYTLATLLLIAIFVRAENSGKTGLREVALWRVIIGVLMLSAGLKLMIDPTIFDANAPLDLRLWLIALPFVGAGLMGFGPLARIVNLFQKQKV